MCLALAGAGGSQRQGDQPRPSKRLDRHEVGHFAVVRQFPASRIPFNIAAGNSSSYNYASGRLDHQTYYKSLRIDQARIETIVLDRLFAAWLDEASLIDGYLPELAAWNSSEFRAAVRRPRVQGTALACQWFWDGQEHVDPQKEATAQATRLTSHTTTLADEYARKGQDWEVQLRQRAKEIALMQSLGLALATAPANPSPSNPTSPDPETDDDAQPVSTDD